MSKVTLKDFISTYMKIHGSASYRDIKELMPCSRGGFTNRITALRSDGWEIETVGNMTYKYIGGPPPEEVENDPNELDEYVKTLRLIADGIEELINEN